MIKESRIGQDIIFIKLHFHMVCYNLLVGRVFNATGIPINLKN